MLKKILFFIVMFNMLCAKAAVIYVKSGGTGNGTSWSQAYGSLNTALQNAVSGDEIWVEQGTYFPSSTLNSAESFVFKDGVKLYGGFAGTETTLASRADTSGTMTVLSGNLSSTVQTEILFKINNASNVNNLIDGFTISGAKRIMVSGNPGGAGLQILNSTLKLKNCIIKDHRVELLNYVITSNNHGGGSAIHSVSSDLVLENVDIIDNSLENIKTGTSGGLVDGGAIYMRNGSLDYNGGRIENNELEYDGTSGKGGAGYFDNLASVSLKNIFAYFNGVFSEGVTAVSKYPEGGAFYFNSCDDILMDTNIFHGNYTQYLNSTTLFYGRGNAVYFNNSEAEINNVTFGRNLFKDIIASNTSVAYVLGNTEISFNNCVFLDQISGSGMLTLDYYRCVSKFPVGYVGDPNNRWAEMEFVNAAEGNYTPIYCSEHLDFGDTTYLSSTVDINGNPRIAGTSSDPGAVEFQNPGTYNRLYVDQSNTNSIKEGVSWDTAFATLQDALNCKCTDSLNNIIMPAEIWVAEGTYRGGKTMEDSFFLNNGQKVYGGFKTGDTLLTQRDSTLLTQQTILSGKYEQDRHTNHVVASMFTYIDTELNSFIVEEGKSPATAYSIDTSGAGIFVRGQATLKNLWVRNNKAVFAGGGIHVYRFDAPLPGVPNTAIEAGVHIENVRITDNIAGDSGGGISFRQDAMSGNYPANNFVSKLKNVEITGNKSQNDIGGDSGGVHVEGRFNIDFKDFDISDNEAVRNATAIVIFNNSGATLNFMRGKIDNNKEILQLQGVNGYAVQSSMYYGNLIPNTINMESVIFSRNNTARTTLSVHKGYLNITNCTFVNNIGGQNQDINPQNGNFLTLADDAFVSIKNSIIDYSNNGLPDVYSYWSNNYTITAENTLFTKAIPTEITNSGGNNLANTNPMFVDKINGNYNLQPNSPAIDVGDNSFLSLSPTLDAVSNNRIYNNIVDLGALEYQGFVSVTQQNKNAQFVLYPNPAESEVFLEFEEYQKGTLAIYDLNGKNVFTLKHIEVDENKPLKINVEKFASGIYIIQWVGNQLEASGKLIKK